MSDIQRCSYCGELVGNCRPGCGDHFIQGADGPVYIGPSGPVFVPVPPPPRPDERLIGLIEKGPAEVMVVNETTGGMKGAKLARYDLIPTEPLRAVAEMYGTGAAKYEPRNWQRGYDWSLSYAAMQRHANAFWSGESLAPDDGQHHLASVVFHALALMEFERTHPELDDRSKT